jgi:hypothetical protein
MFLKDCLALGVLDRVQGIALALTFQLNDFQWKDMAKKIAK